LASLLAACSGFVVSVRTEVGPDGTISRRVQGGTASQSEYGDEHPPTPFRKYLFEPGAPYEVVKLEECAFSALAELESGVHPSGVRRRAFPDSDIEAEGTFEVDVADLGIGTLYSYRERISSGANPLAFRASLRRWLEFGMDLLVEALRPQYPDIDFEPLKENARTRILPRIETSILLLRDRFELLARYHRDQWRRGDEREGLFANRYGRMIEEELARCGITRIPEGETGRNDLVHFDGSNWELDPALFLEFLGSQPEREPVAEQIARLIGRLDYRAAFERLYPTREEQERVREEFVRFWVSAFGCWFGGEFLLEQDLRFRLTMPGTLIHCDGELGRAPELRWGFHGLLLAFRDEELHAVTFHPVEGIPATGWRHFRLLELRDQIRNLAPEERSRVPGFVAYALDHGWEEALEIRPITTDLYNAVKSLGSAVRYASRHAKDREGEGVED
jgi:hypothetical protein